MILIVADAQELPFSDNTFDAAVAESVLVFCDQKTVATEVHRHGIIAPITFVISIFRPDVNVYEVHNDGSWYNLGFVLGAGVLLGGSSATRR